MADIPKTYSATVSHDLCVGIGMCMQHAPGAFDFDFDFDDEGLSVFQPDGEWTRRRGRRGSGRLPDLGDPVGPRWPGRAGRLSAPEMEASVTESTRVCP